MKRHQNLLVFPHLYTVLVVLISLAPELCMLTILLTQVDDIFPESTSSFYFTKIRNFLCYLYFVPYKTTKYFKPCPRRKRYSPAESLKLPPLERNHAKFYKRFAISGPHKAASSPIALEFRLYAASYQINLCDKTRRFMKRLY
jgi:hypothetical protein